MLKEAFSTRQKLRHALGQYQPAENLLQDDGRYVRTSLMLAVDTANTARSIYNQAPKNKSYILGKVASGAVMLAGISFAANDNGLRMYLLDNEHAASELPSPPLEGAHTEKLESVTLKLEPGTWSLLKTMEEDRGLSPDSALRYGFAIIQTMWANPDLDLAFVDRKGKSAPITTNLTFTLGLSGPPELA